MTLLFVYGRQERAAASGSRSARTATARQGFVAEADTVAWQHMVLSFAIPPTASGCCSSATARPDRLHQRRQAAGRCRADPLKEIAAKGKLPPTQPGDRDRARDVRRPAEAVLPAAGARRQHHRAEVRLHGAHGEGGVGDAREGRRQARRDGAAQQPTPHRQLQLGGGLRDRRQRVDAALHRPHPRRRWTRCCARSRPPRSTSGVRFGLVAYRRTTRPRSRASSTWSKIFADPNQGRRPASSS